MSNKWRIPLFTLIGLIVLYGLMYFWYQLHYSPKYESKRDNKAAISDTIDSATLSPTTRMPRDNRTADSAKEWRSQLSKFWSGDKCRNKGPVTFSHSPMKLDDVGVILPYGLLADAHVTPIDHMYFSPKNFQSKRDEYPVFAIADGTIVRITHRGDFVGDHQKDRPTDEYRLDVEYTCSFYSYYDLLTSLAPELATKVGKTGDKGHWSYSERIPIKAGQEIGRVGGQTVDWAVYNTDVKLNFIKPEHYDYEPWKIHTDPRSFDYFTPELKEQLLKLVARQVEPRLGKIDYDQSGKAVGNWFAVGTNGYGGLSQQRYWDGHLSLVYDYIDPSQIRFSIGNFGGKAAQFGLKDNTPDPATINVDSGLVKVELQRYEHYNRETGRSWSPHTGPISQPAARNTPEILGTALLQMLSPDQLKVEVFPGKQSNEVSGFTAAAKIYER